MTEKLRKTLKKMYMKFFSIIPIYIKSKTAKKKIFLLYTPTHPNMGDLAIRMGEKTFFEYFLNIHKLVEINERLWCKYTEKSLKRIIEEQDLIMIHGGGYLGDLWLNGEENFKHIVESFPKNKIVALSNTAYYSDTEDGRRLLKEDKDFYEKHENVIFYLRDKASYELMSDTVGKERCFYKPDMALMLKPDYKVEKKDILICARHDHEKVQSSESFERIKQSLENKGYSVKYTDTVKSVGRRFKYSQGVRDKCFEETLKEFAGAKLIITDRLHGMVLSAITKTPCIAADNISKKVSGVYEWIKHLDYIRVMTPEYIEINAIEEMLQKKPIYDNGMLMEEFEKMAEEIRIYWEK